MTLFAVAVVAALVGLGLLVLAAGATAHLIAIILLVVAAVIGVIALMGGRGRVGGPL